MHHYMNTMTRSTQFVCLLGNTGVLFLRSVKKI